MIDEIVCALCGEEELPTETCVVCAEKLDDEITSLRDRTAELEKQADCTHFHNGVSQFSPYKHVWKCDRCGNVQDLEGKSDG